ncbi:hypothetical protein F2P81_014609 [Scophthalmus maximus]|uniref:Uncharacterized protein n=1 Tax=Scophthalmus maximus TaxID=52904 RepID=A0A6A4SIH9_SCOMX|nr:hypothetical protein F2P81_014609 [Scophthalmus maximus]
MDYTRSCRSVRRARSKSSDHRQEELRLRSGEGEREREREKKERKEEEEEEEDGAEERRASTKPTAVSRCYRGKDPIKAPNAPDPGAEPLTFPVRLELCLVTRSIAVGKEITTETATDALLLAMSNVNLEESGEEEDDNDDEEEEEEEEEDGGGGDDDDETGRGGSSAYTDLCDG